MALRNSAVDVKSLIQTIAEFLRLQDWRFEVFVLPLDALQSAFNERSSNVSEEVVYGYTTYDQYERLAHIYLCKPEELQRDGLSVVELALHEMLHVLVDGNRPATDDISSERAIRTLTELLLPRLKRLVSKRSKKCK